MAATQTGGSQTITRPSRLAAVVGSLLSRPSGVIGLLLVGAHVLLALLSPYIAPFDFKAMNANAILSPPDAAHWLGTDQLGRDILTRTIMGGRQAILVTAIATPLAVAWGGLLGIYLGLAGGRLDDILMRVVDAFLALPWILKMLLMIVTFGTGIGVLIPTLAFFYGIPVIRIARAFGMNCLAFDSCKDEELAAGLGFRYVTLDQLLRKSDVVTLHIPLTPRTRHLLNAKRLARTKPGFILINTARGALVDIDALLAGLKSGHVGGVGLDVLEDEAAFRADPSRIIGAQIVQKIHAVSTPGGDPERRQERLRELQGFMRNRQLLAHANVFFTPHVGFNSVEAIERINLGTVQNIRDFIAGKLRPGAVAES